MVRSPKITWNGYKINRVKSFKYLGIHVDDRLNWLEHINKQEKPSKMQPIKRIAGQQLKSLRYTDGLSIKRLLRMLAHGSSAVSKSNIKMRGFLRFKAILTPYIEELIAPPQRQRYKPHTRHPLHAGSSNQVYFNFIA
ncbi:hypothetical protein AVEN_17431-1 [Araneus ventricosus]|uniref:Uncharacterized protein n=1 Tax=Araneus ventricosus TaxID=182803 RepID=A0A4Y2DN91_ARAVE|nr:hypothetical protein AVEN_17431-1 [Araneus ventricosus]